MDSFVMLEMTLISIGFVIMSVAIFLYFRLAKKIDLVKGHIDRLTLNLFRLYIILMIFFLIGYGFIDASLKLGLSFDSMLLISFIFFFGGVFVIIGIIVQLRLTDCIYNGNIQVIKTLVSAVEARDLNLKGHSMHVMAITLLIYDHLPKNKTHNIDREKLEYASLLHDIGKLGIPESILNKPGKLNDEEWVIMKDHPRIGTVILNDIDGLKDTNDWILYHHERMDGKGYYHLEGENIPFAAKIISIADSYSAIVMRRSYKKALEHHEAIKIMRECSGSQFDSYIFEVFAEINEVEVKKHLSLLEQSQQLIEDIPSVRTILLQSEGKEEN